LNCKISHGNAKYKFVISKGEFMMKKTIFSLVIPFFILFGFSTFSYAETAKTTPPATGSAPANPGTSPITVTPPAQQPNPAVNPVNIAPQDLKVQEPVPTDTKGKVLYYLKRTWAALVTIIVVIILLWLYTKESWGSKRTT
jgi:hypothetical protein